jgi:hypothetical protein
MKANAVILDLAANLSALEIIVETLLVDHLAEDPNPAVIGDGMVKSGIQDRTSRPQCASSVPPKDLLHQADKSLSLLSR